MSYYLPNGDVVKQWLFNGPALDAWWGARSRKPMPNGYQAIESACMVGKTLPTSEITYERDGRFNKVLNTKVGTFPPAIGKFLNEVNTVFGDFEVIRVVS